jgi:hypothetical protein
MNADGSDQGQVTNAEGGMPVFADNDWIYYQHGVARSLWRVSTDGKKQEPVFETRPYRGSFAFSPTGTRAASFAMRNERPAVIIISIPEGRELDSYALADGKGRYELAWLPDESAIAYSLSDSEGETNSLWIQSLAGGEPRRSGDLGHEEIAFLSFVPEADSIAFAQGGWKHDLVILGGFR